MAKTTIDTWNPAFLESSPLFTSLREVAQPFTQHRQWPTLEQLAEEFRKRNIQSHNNIQIKPVAQGEAPEKFEDHYESRIYLKGELQTRLENWHDFFNAAAWLQFPKTKAALNCLHFENSKSREAGSNRSPLENAITLFDECGAIIVADNENYLELIRNHQWKEIFCDKKHIWGKNIQCYIFGHAMHEKALAPYLGMTSHTLLINKPEGFFSQPEHQQVKNLDIQVSEIWSNKVIEKTKDLQPLPLLGVPSWWNGRQNESFYNDKSYFRPLRKKPSAVSCR
ncbi:MAG: DUF3025 domain-containing protein [Gammaproteobacteria bacterium]|nr:DUF3025 domain-containing protein [Gammaproteobacteria bacterium]